MKTKVETNIVLPRIDIRKLDITIIGDSSLICHAWSDKAKKEMRDKQMKKAVPAKQAKDPERDFFESLYHMEGGGYGFPAVALKAAAVSACRAVENLTMVQARSGFHIDAEFVPIEGCLPTMREDMVRIGMGTADIRYRGEFKNWFMHFVVRFNANMFSEEQIINLFETAGFGVGIGEWRPERNGNHGLFHVRKSDEKLPVGDLLI